MRRRQSGEKSSISSGDIFKAPIREAYQARGRRSGVSTHLAWAGGGFILGVVCWHMVGFWSFVDRVLAEAAPAARLIVAADAPPIEARVTKKISDRLLTVSSSGDCVRRIATQESAESVVQPCALPVVALQQGLVQQ